MPDRGFVGPNALRAFLVTSLFVSAPTVSEAAQAVAEPSAALLQEFAERLEGRVAAAASGSYDCAGRQFAGYEVTGDIGQWIDGHVFRWRELQAADGRRCIEVTKPFQKFLTEDEASTLLSVSAYGLRSQTRRNAADTVPGGAPAIIADPTGPAPAAAEADGRLRGDVFGPDTRVRVADTTAAPWRYVTFIEFDTAGRRNVGCTGVLISPYAALTAAHCLYNKTDGDAVSPRVFPAITTAAGAGNVPIIPYGGRWGAGVDRLPNWAINPIAYRYDLAVVYVAQPFTQFTTFTPIDYQAVVTNEMHSPAVSLGRPQNLTMGSLTVVGYSGDAVRGETPLYPTMWVSLSSATTSTDLYNIFHDADRSAREAGAPILGASAFGVYRLVGIHSNSHSSTTTNVGTRLNTLHRSYIEAWAAWRPSTSNAPQSGWWWSVSESGRG
jgi:V8-like Glu-specific endopeptidase